VLVAQGRLPQEITLRLSTAGKYSHAKQPQYDPHKVLLSTGGGYPGPSKTWLLGPDLNGFVQNNYRGSMRFTWKTELKQEAQLLPRTAGRDMSPETVQNVAKCS